MALYPRKSGKGNPVFTILIFFETFHGYGKCDQFTTAVLGECTRIESNPPADMGAEIACGANEFGAVSRVDTASGWAGAVKPIYPPALHGAERPLVLSFWEVSHFNVRARRAEVAPQDCRIVGRRGGILVMGAYLGAEEGTPGARLFVDNAESSGIINKVVSFFIQPLPVSSPWTCPFTGITRLNG